MEGFPVVITLPVQWSEMDVLGHVNNARFFTWFESARITLFRTIGVLGARTGNLGPVLRTTACEYLKPVVYPADVRVGVRVTTIGNSSVQMEYAVALAGAEGELVARGTSTAVLVDFETGRPVRIPDETRDAITKLNGSPG